MTDEMTSDDLPSPDYEGWVPVDELETDGENPNEMTDEQFGSLCSNMRRNGWLDGKIITNTDGLIADGEHRWLAAQEIGLSEVPVKQYDIDEPTRRLWRLEQNKIHGEHDTKRDALEYDYLLNAGKSEEVGELTDATGEDLDELIDEIRLDKSRPPAYEYDPDHNVYFEDCVEGMRERIEDDSVDCVITDPPYGIDLDLENAPETTNNVRRNHTVEADKTVDDAIRLYTQCLTEFKRVLAEDGHFYTFCSWKTYPEFRDAIENGGFEVKSVVVWEKTDPNALASFSDARYRYAHEWVIFATHSDSTPRRLYDSPQDVVTFPDAQHADNGSDQSPHPTQKPVELIRWLQNNSTQEGDTVLDPFMGSGTTAVAAIQNNRDYVGFELDEENYRPVIERRIGEAKRATEADVNQESTGAESDD